MALSSGRKKQIGRAAGRQLARFTRFVLKTSEIVMDPPNAQSLILEEYPPIVAVWHGQFMMVAALQPEGFEAEAVVARHGDAEVIAEALKPFNVKLARGAGSQGRKFKKERGGVSALRQAIRALQENRAVVITADVPPGPARVAGAGIATLAKLSGRPVVPVAVATSRYKALNTWSRMTINLPYSKLVCVVGDKIWVPDHVTSAVLEQKRQDIETALNDVTARAYRLSGGDATAATPVSAVPVDAPLPEPGVKLKLYRGFTTLVRPLAPILFRQRARRGKEDRARREERYGTASIARPDATVVWFHGASVGEANAVLPLIEQMLKDRDDLFIVLTTGTVTSAALAKGRLGARAVHQFVPYDSPVFARRFLEHWQPDLAVFTESEIWPNLILETSARSVPLALVNGRMSKKSHERWRKNRGLSAPLFSRFRLVLAQSPVNARRFADLGARHVIDAGNLKADAPAPPFDEDLLQTFRRHLRGREIFVAASTHAGEDEHVVAAHRILQRTFPNLCTIIVPRHPERGTSIAEMAKSMGLRVAQRSLGQWPTEACDVFIADSIGELGLYYALTDIAFVGGSFIDHGGQNPLEAVRLSAAVLTGPSQHSFSEAYRALINCGAVREVASGEDLAATVAQLMADRAAQANMVQAGHTCLEALGGALALTTEALLDLLPREPEERLRASQ